MHDDAYYDGLWVGIREVHAWLRGPYLDVSVTDIDSILKILACASWIR
jgi:hypothetical protein